MPKLQADLDGIVRILAEHLYAEPDAFVRELLQNAHDAIRLRRRNGRDFEGRIRIEIDLEQGRLLIRDNGLGMGRDDIEDFLSTIGSSGTRRRTQALLRERSERSVPTIGQFGIGLLASFAVADRLTIRTRRVGDDATWEWVSEGGARYRLAETTDRERPGTTVAVSLDDRHRDFLDAGRLRETIERYADLLPVPIYLNGDGLVNAAGAPWSERGWSESPQRLSAFVEEHHDVSPLLTIAVDLDDPAACGVLYVRPSEVPGRAPAGDVDLYHNGMAIRRGESELLPDWARFVRGIVDSPQLSPTTSRNDVLRDDVFYELRGRLTDEILEALRELSNSHPERFARLCRTHHLSIKGMAWEHDEFFDAVVDLVPFETNEGRLTLPEFARRQEPVEGEVPFYVFSDERDAGQFYDLCDARDVLCLNAGRIFERELVERFVERDEDWSVVRLESADAPLLGREQPEVDEELARLESAAARALRDRELDQVVPQIRAFEPSSMPSLVLEGEQHANLDELEGMLSRMQETGAMSRLVDDGLDAIEEYRVRLFLNADNELVRRLAGRPGLVEGRYDDVIVHLYFAALLRSRRRLDRAASEQFHGALIALLDRHVGVVERGRGSVEMTPRLLEGLEFFEGRGAEKRRICEAYSTVDELLAESEEGFRQKLGEVWYAKLLEEIRAHVECQVDEQTGRRR